MDRLGLPALTLEARATPADDAGVGLAVNLPGNAVRALHRLGVTPGELGALGSPVRRREYRNERGRLLFAVDETRFWGEEAQPRCLRRSDLMKLLACEVPAGGVRGGARVTSLTGAAGDPGGAVRLGLADGSFEPCDFVVGADGVHSAVRRAAFGDGAPRTALVSEASWRFMAPDPGIDCWTGWSGAGGALFLLIPVDRGEVYGWVTAPGRDADGLRAAFAGFPRIVRDTLDAAWEQPVPPYPSPLEEVRMPAWTRDRVVLIGDAAHATSPMWAQGVGLAVEDALVLAELLADVDDWSLVGPEYERRRRSRVEHVAAATDRISRLAALPSWLRDAVAPLAGPLGYRAAYRPLRESVIGVRTRPVASPLG
jgi:2-polyprenyl-6-methoxyphenol hydroxylase-like FAD-dependent oxidoreductase